MPGYSTIAYLSYVTFYQQIIFTTCPCLYLLCILLGDMILIDDVKKAHKLLKLFFKLVPQLYYPEMCAANMHSLIHLKQFVINWGPLWGYSCFGFESMNGHLRKSCHGTRYVLPQLVHNIMMRQGLPLKGKAIASSAKSRKTANFIASLSGVKEKSEEIEIKSRITHTHLKDVVIDSLRSASLLTSASASASPSFPTCSQI